MAIQVQVYVVSTAFFNDVMFSAIGIVNVVMEPLTMGLEKRMKR